MLRTQEKETRVKFIPGLSAKRPSNNWALLSNLSVVWLKKFQWYNVLPAPVTKLICQLEAGEKRQLYYYPMTLYICPLLEIRLLFLHINPHWVRGGGVVNKVLYRKALPRGSTPYPFIYYFLAEKVRLSYTFYWQIVYILVQKCYIAVNCYKCNVFAEPESFLAIIETRHRNNS